MRVVLLSDTHNHDFTRLNLPDGDLLIHAGDWTNRGTIGELVRFNDYCGKAVEKYKYGIWVTPGNHDFLAQTATTLCENLLTNCNLMINERVTFDGINFWFSPYTPFFCNWAFMEEIDELATIWDKIPDDTNVLITHGPPKNILDVTVDDFMNVGCLELRKKIKRLPNLQLHAFGHIHSNYGKLIESGVTFANVSSCDETYTLRNRPWVIDIDTSGISFAEPI